MTSDFWARALGIAFGVLAAATLGSLVAEWGEPVLRTIARALFAGALLELGVQAWRFPSRRPRRFRDRTARFLRLVAQSESHVELAETTPQVPLPLALLDDWDVLRGERLLLAEGSLTPAEVAALDDFARVVDHLRPSLLDLGPLPVRELADREPWRLFVAAARKARIGLGT